MLQFGQNAGARNIRVYGIVNNLLRKNLSSSEREAKDRRILGAFGIAWAILQSNMPKEVTDACDQAIASSGMDTMTYMSDSEG